MSPGARAVSWVMMIPVPVRSTEPAGTGLERRRNSTISSILRASREVEVAPEKIVLSPRVMVQVILRL